MKRLYKNFLLLIAFGLVASGAYAQTVTLTNLTTGIQNPPQMSSDQVNVPIFGFDIRVTGGASTFTAINIPVTSTPIGKFLNYKLYKSTDNDASTTVDNVLVGGITITPTATQIQITGLSQVLSGTRINYFLVVDIDPSVTTATPSIRPSVAAANVTVSAGSVTAGLTGQTYTFYDHCTGGVPFHVVDLTGQPAGVYLSPSESRAGICCGFNPNPPENNVCVDFLVTLDPGSQGIRFDVASGAVPGGAMFWSLNCGPQYPVGENICLNSVGPHKVTLCKPGNNPNSYTITSIAAPGVSPPTVVSNSCTSTITATGYDVTLPITWTSISPGAVGAHNGYLSCTSGCLSTTATYAIGAPDSVDYQVCGTPSGGCTGVQVCNTVRVYFVNDKAVTIVPANPTICFGGSNTTITANPTGGKPPYAYAWSGPAIFGPTNTQTITVGAGTHTVVVSDATSCPTTQASVTVTANASLITADAGPDVTSCVNNPNVTMVGTVVQATGGVWTGGAGTYTTTSTTVGNTTTVSTVYTPTAAERVAGTIITHRLTTTGNGSCPVVFDETTHNIVATPVVVATDVTVCANNAAAAITGTVTNAGGGTWTGGGGTFFPDRNTLVVTYTPSAAETAAFGTPVVLTLTSTNNGTCNPVSDPMNVNITAPPTIDANVNQTVCANNAVVTLTGIKNGVVTAVQWTSNGSGTFAPGGATSTSLTPTYTPSAADKTAGTVRLTLTSTAQGTCSPVSDFMDITITPAPTANANVDQTVCANNSVVTLAGSVTLPATGGTWTVAPNVGSFSNANSLTSTYTPPAGTGVYTLTLTTTPAAAGNCIPVTDQMTVTVTTAPTAIAGGPFTVCGNNAAVSLNGSVTPPATGGTWSGGTGAFAPNNNTLTTTYTPSAAEIAAGTVTLTLTTTTGNGNCLPATSTTTITITPAPTVNANVDQTVCANNAVVTLAGSKNAVATAVQWTSNGSGTFAPGGATSTSLTPTYTPSAADKTAGTVRLTLTSTAQGTCNPVSDFMDVTITPAPTANANADQTVCANNSVVTLAGSVTLPATGGTWTVAPNVGSFSDANSLTSTYTPPAGTGVYTLTLTTTPAAAGNCIPVTDQMIVTVTTAPTANAGGPYTVCSNNAAVSLSGSVTAPATGGTWSGGGGGFAPNANTLIATYNPTAAEIAAGSVILTLSTTTGNGSCLPATSNTTITFTTAPVVDAGIPQTVCGNNRVVTLAGTKNAVATAVQWTSNGTGVFAPGGATSTSLTPTYTPSNADTTAGTVTLTLTSTAQGTCNPVSDFMVITITDAPRVNAGVDQTICATNAQTLNPVTPAVTLAGSVTSPATGGVWTVAPNVGTFSNSASLTSTYTPPAGPGTYTLTLTTTPAAAGNCIAVTDQMVVTVTAAPTVDAGLPKTVCANNANVTLTGTFTVATGGQWIPISGTGTFSPNTTTATATYIPSAADIAGVNVCIKWRTTGNGICLASEDTVCITIFPAPVVNANSDQSICKNNNVATLNGSVLLSPTTRTWSTAGDGVFGNVNTLNTTYTPGPTDLAAGAATLTLTATKTQAGASCNSVSDVMVITYTNPPTVNAGGDQTVCANNAVVTLAGAVTAPATGGTWSGGTGTFGNANALSTTYTPSPAELLALAPITLTLTTTPANAGNCIPVTDQMVISLTPAPTANANSDQSVCANNATTTLNGIVTIATGGTWTSTGSGIFAPNNTTLGASYLPSAADTTANTVTLTLTTTGNGNCNPVNDQMVLTITDAPKANAGPDVIVCADNPVASLVGNLKVSTAAQWVGGLGSYNSDNTDLTPLYTATPAEVSAGSVTLTLVTTANGNCNSVSDQVLITIGPAPTVNAGSDQVICSTSPNAPLNGTVTVATGGTWTTNGTGTFSPNANTLNASYVPSAADKTAGNITLTLTTTGNGTCLPVMDQMVVTITANPTSSAGPNQTVCTNSLPVALAGTGSPSQWVGGTGTFNPNRSTLNAIYTPSNAEIIAQTVTLTLQPNPIGGCATPAATTVTITIPPGPTANANSDQVLCGDVASVNLTGIIGGTATGGTWTTAGTGTFGNANAPVTTYVPSAADVTAGTVTLTLTTTGTGSCIATQDQMVITLTPTPTISAGPDLSRCADVTTVPVTGTKNAVVTSFVWTTSGTGTFSPNNSSLVFTYNPSAADKTGSVTLTISSTGTGTCNPVSDAMTITFTPAPTVTPIPSFTVCSDTAFFILNGSFTAPATGAIWTGGAGGTYSANNVSLPTSYIPTAAERVAGSIIFTLTTTGNGTCNAVSGTTTVTVTAAPTISAGPDRSVCADVTGVNLNGATITVAGGQIWTTSGSGTFSPSANALNPTYNLSAADKAGGTVTLTIKSTSNGDCKQVQDQMVITITPAPTANAGPDRTICADAANVNLPGAVGLPATGGTWTSTGTGSFTPNANTLLASYVPSAGDKSGGVPITITLTTTTGIGTCTPVSDAMILNITPAPTINPLAPQTVCADVATVTLNGTVNIATGGDWTTTGTGTFSPDNINPTDYILSAAERATAVNITRTMTLTTTGNGTCNPVSSNFTLTITPAPTVNAGVNQTVCGNNAVVTLAGTKNAVATATLWSTNGTGAFSNSTSLTPTYTPSAADITAGTVNLTLSSTAQGTCNPVSNTMIVSFTPAPVVNAGADRIVCANNAQVGLGGTVSVAAGGKWTSSGTGSFSPDDVTLNATYIPSAADLTSSPITLTLSSTGNGTCIPVSDAMTVTITPAPTTDAGPAQTVCANNSAITLAGTVTVATGGDWSGGTGTFAPNASTLLGTYSPSPAEIAAGTVTLTLTSSGNGTCNAVTDVVTFTITPAPVVNAGPDQGICADLASTPLAGSVTVMNAGTWTTSGSGTFLPDATTLNASYQPSATDKTNGSVTLTLTSPNLGGCLPVVDQMIITIAPIPVVNAGNDQTICADLNNITLNGSVNFAGGGNWTTSGSGTFSPGSTTLNGFYTPSAVDKTSSPITLTLTSTGNGTCNPVTDQMSLTITPAPTISADVDQVICADAAGVTLNGTFTVATGLQWSTSGTGTFTPNNVTFNATYIPSAADKTAGLVTITATSTGTGTCNTVTDQMTITITPAPTVNAGPDLNMCADQGSILVTGTVTVATGGTWTTASGTGTFAPNANTLQMTFTPSALQISQGFARLTLTTTGNGTCNAVTDQMQVNIAPIPVVSAGPNQTICANTASATMAGTVTNATGGTWTTSGTGTFANANVLNTTYTPSAADKTAGNITLTLTSSGNGLCQAYSSSMNLRINPVPVVNAGPPTLCVNSPTIPLTGTVSNATGGQWSTSGTGIFSPNANVLTVSYAPSAADFAALGVTLTLTSTGNGPCAAVSDVINVVLQGAPTANAGPDQVVCANNNAVTLAGAFGGASTGGIWTSTGGGSFAPSNTTPNATYTPSAIDVVNGTVTLTFTTTGVVGGCNSASDNMVVTITPPPTANAGIDKTVCANNNVVTINGSVTVATGGTWSSSTGTGVFGAPGNLNTTYTPSAAEIAAGTVNLILTTTGNGLCTAVTDQMILTITPAPVVTVDPDQDICSDAAGVGISGTVTVATGGQWTSSGTGTFNNSAALTTIYNFSAADKAAGTVSLTLTSTGNGTCIATNDVMLITIPAAPIVTASAANSCSDSPSIPLVGSVTNATGGVWSTSGDGSFSDLTLNPDYLLVPAGMDITNGSVTLTLTTTGADPACGNTALSFLLNIIPSPTADAGMDQTVCKNNSAVVLAGSYSNSDTLRWTSTGTGTFSPDDTTLLATYNPSAADLAAGTVKIAITTVGNGICSPASDTMTVTFAPAPTVNAGPAIICTQNPTVPLSATSTIAGGVVWSTSGDGTFLSTGTNTSTSLNDTYVLGVGDAGSANFTLTITTTANTFNCLPATDNILVNVNDAPTPDGDGAQTVCANNRDVDLSGATLNAPFTPSWSTLGTGTFAPGGATSASLNPVYTPSDADTAAGTVILVLTATDNSGVCSAVTDTVVVTITDAPTINLGPATVCANNPPMNLNAVLTVATTGTWTRAGTGTFAPGGATSTSLTPAYTPGGGETSVVFTFTTDPTPGGCVAENKSITLFITPPPIANSVADFTVCADSVDIPLGGSQTIPGSPVWSIVTGSGSFTNGGVAPGASYVPVAADTAAGSVKLVLTTTGNGSCNAATDTLNITITDAPIVNANVDQTVCANNAVVTLAGSKNAVVTTVQWTSSGSGVFAPGGATSTSLTPTYTPSAADTAAGSVTFVLTSTAQGICKQVSDTMVVTITDAPTVNAGPATICSDAAADGLSGVVTVATGGTWTTTGTGFFAAPNNLTTSYIVSAADRIMGTVTLYLTTTGNGLCNSVQDSIRLNIIPAPTADAGGTQNICADAGTVNVSGTTVSDNGHVWTTLGTGGFVDPSLLNTTYNLSDPDTAAHQVILVLTTIQTNGCTPASDSVTIDITPAPITIVNAGNDQTICADVTQVALNGQILNAAGGEWTTDGNGIFIPDAFTLNASYMPDAVDTADGSITLTLTSTGNGICNPVVDVMILTITPAPLVTVPADQTVCANNSAVALSGTVSNAGGGTWVTSGAGSFTPNADDLNATYNPVAADIADSVIVLTLTSRLNGTCNPVSKNMKVYITPAPTINAGPDQTVCSDNNVVTLSGSTTIATAVQWTRAGTGAFSASTSLNTDYTFTSADSAAGSVLITLTTTAQGNCNPVSDNMLLVIGTGPTINAGNDTTICADAPGVFLYGTKTVASGAIWTSSGTGAFFPNNVSLTSTYVPSDDDTLLGNVTLTLTSTGNGTCNPVSDQLTVTIDPLPVVDAGPDTTFCADVAVVNLTGKVLNSTGGSWSTSGTGGFGAANPVTTYTPSPADKAAGLVTLTLTSDATANCNPVSDQMIIRFTPAPTANAGPDQTVCADVLTVSLNGSVTLPATGGTWSILAGFGALPAPNNLSTDYSVSVIDTAVKTVTLLLTTTTGNGTCNPATDAMTITFTPAPYVNAIANQTVCGDVTSITLSGTVQHATGGEWASSGSGVFSPNANVLGPDYAITAADTAAGSVTFTLSSTGNGTCGAVSDQMVLTITPTPVVDAGPDQTVCANNATVSLSGTATVATGGDWSSAGSGTFTNQNSLTTATYTPSPADIAAGSVLITLTSSGQGTCNPVTDNMLITFTTSPTINAGPDRTVCGNNRAVSLNAAVTVATGGTWTSTGSGTFSPNINSLVVTYTPSNADTTAGTVTLVVTSTGQGSCLAVTDTVVVTITDIPTSISGAGVTVCADITAGVALSGAVTNATGGIWTTGGTGVFSPDASTLNATYFPSAADKTAGTVGLTLTTSGMGNCLAVSSTKVITITKAPTANAGIDKTICADATGVTVIGTVTIATSGTWTSSGTGTFNPAAPDNLTVTYTPSAGDIAAGVVNLTLTTTTGNGTCNPVSDMMKVTITPAPTVNAGVDKTVCADLNAIPVSGSVTTATGGTWTSSGGGTFSPNANTLNISYNPTPADKTAGTVTLTLTTTGNGTCNAYTDQTVITITPAPIVSTGALTACADSQGLLLNGSVSNAGGGAWTSTGSGVFSPNAFTLAASYTPSIADATAGLVVLTLTSTSNGTCNPVSANMNLIITPLPVSDAGPDVKICRGTSTDLIALQQSVSNSYMWFTLGNVQISSTMAVTISSSVDTSFIVQATDNKGCSTRDTVDVLMVDPPVFSLNDHFCLVTPLNVNSNPSVIPATGGFQWYENGNSMIGETATTLDITKVGTYIVEYKDGRCAAYDTTLVTPPPTLFSPDTLVCASQSLDIKTTSIPGASYAWTQYVPNGTPGSINGASNTFQINVTATSVNDDSTYFVVTVTDNLSCSSNDSVKVVTVPLITLTLADMNSCAGDSVTLDGNPGFTLVGAQYNWLYGATPASVPSSLGINDTSSQITVKIAGVYYLDYVAGGCVAKDSAVVNFNPRPVINLADARNCFEDNPSFTLDAGTGPALDPYTSYLWFTVPDTIIGPKTNQTFDINSPGEIFVTVTNANNCPSTDSLNALDICPPKFDIPTAFFPTKNTSGIDPSDPRYKDLTFRPFTKNVKNLQFTVFNRWGEIIFYTEDPNEGWDGTYRGDLMETGTYPWTVVYDPQEEEFGGTRREKGAVTILKGEE
jgi:gliding motility-associated-like protein